MIVARLTTLKQEVNWPYRPLCRCATLAYSTFMRWKARDERGEPLIRRPGPHPVGPLDLEGLQTRLRALEYGRHRTAGTTRLYNEVRPAISRRNYQGMVNATRREDLQARQAGLGRVQWLMPGAVWSIDPTELVIPGRDGPEKLHLLPGRDQASRYGLPPLVTDSLPGDVVAAVLEDWFLEYGPPLVLKRDNGSNLNDQAVNEVLARFLVIPLNSPRHYPPYNGGMEQSQHGFQQDLLARAVIDGAVCWSRSDPVWTPVAISAVQERNHRPRRSLRGQIPCAVFARAKAELAPYTRRRRKDAFEAISEMAMHNLAHSPAHGQRQADAAWRRAVQTWLQREGIIALIQPKSVTRFP